MEQMLNDDGGELTEGNLTDLADRSGEGPSSNFKAQNEGELEGATVFDGPAPLELSTLKHDESCDPGDWREEVEGWPEVVDGDALLEELAATLRRFVVLPKYADTTLALWVVHTYAFQLREVSTYVGVESPEKRCGKTTLLTVLSELVHRPIVASNISSPAFFRVIEEVRPTLLIDEADTFLQGNDELRGILNSGYSRKTAFVVRVAGQAGTAGSRVWDLGSGAGGEAPSSKGKVRNGGGAEVISDPYGTQGDKFYGTNKSDGTYARAEGNSKLQIANSKVVPERTPGEGNSEQQDDKSCARPRPTTGSRLARFSCWCPKVVAAIGRLPETLADRCIVVRMQRKTSREECERLRQLSAAELKRKCARFVRDNAAAIGRARPELPASLNDRAADIWEPLLAVADLAGGPWPELARTAAVALTTTAQEQNPIATLLLDIWVIFVTGRVERLFSRSMVARLNAQGERPWNEMNRGREITDLWLSQQLRPYGVKPRNLWIEGVQAKGYLHKDFEEVFRRYIPKGVIEAWLVEAKADAAEREANQPKANQTGQDSLPASENRTGRTAQDG